MHPIPKYGTSPSNCSGERGAETRRMWGEHLRLTDAPLDLDNPAHLDALKRAYARFPGIGGRTAP